MGLLQVEAPPYSWEHRTAPHTGTSDSCPQALLAGRHSLNRWKQVGMLPFLNFRIPLLRPTVRPLEGRRCLGPQL